MSRAVAVEPQGDREIVMTRGFAAPRERVFAAWTTPAVLQQWLGVQGGWTFPVCAIDLRVGGAYRYVWQNEDGVPMGASGEYREVRPPERLVATEKFDEPWYPGEALLMQEFAAEGAGTVMRLTVRYESKEARDTVLASPMREGFEAGCKNLDALLASGAA